MLNKFFFIGIFLLIFSTFIFLLPKQAEKNYVIWLKDHYVNASINLDEIVIKAKISREEREGFLLSGISKLRFSLTLPKNPFFSFGYGLQKNIETAENTVNYVMEIGVKKKGSGRKPEVIFTKIINDHASNKWHNAKLDMRKYSSKDVELTISAKNMKKKDNTKRLFFTNPVIYKKSTEDPSRFFMSKNQGSSKYNVILMVVDALRQDRLETYGYERDTSQHIDKFARKSVVFENAYSQAPWTLPSISSLFTSSYSSKNSNSYGLHKVVPNLLTLAEALQDAGYSTAGFVSNPIVFSSAVDFSKGFRSFNGKCVWKRAACINKKALKWLKSNDSGPFFLYLHYMEPHDPYKPPSPYDTMYDPEYSGKAKNKELFRKLKKLLEKKEPLGLDMADKRHFNALYDGEIKYFDDEFKKFMDSLARLGRDKNTMIIITADHGEELFDRNEIGHGNSLYQELVKVPLIIFFPGKNPLMNNRIKHNVSLIDLFPTILDFNQIPLRTKIQGKSLINSSKENLYSETIFTELYPHGDYRMTSRQIYSIIEENWKLIYYLRDNKYLLFNLAKDPGETKNLFEIEIKSANRLKRRLKEILLKNSGKKQFPIQATKFDRNKLPAATVEKLRALGYLQ